MYTTNIKGWMDGWIDSDRVDDRVDMWLPWVGFIQVFSLSLLKPGSRGEANPPPSPSHPLLRPPCFSALPPNTPAQGQGWSKPAVVIWSYHLATWLILRWTSNSSQQSEMGECVFWRCVVMIVLCSLERNFWKSGQSLSLDMVMHIPVLIHAWGPSWYHKGKRLSLMKLIAWKTEEKQNIGRSSVTSPSPHVIAHEATPPRRWTSSSFQSTYFNGLFSYLSSNTP